MRTIVALPMYRALHTLAERKQAFARYIDDRRRTERDEQRAQFVRAKEAFRSLLESLPDGVIKPGAKYRKLVPMIRDKPEYLLAPGDKERQEWFAEFIEEVRRKELEVQRAVRKRTVEKFRGILASLGCTVGTRWKQVKEQYSAHPLYLEDSELKAMDAVDFLATFEEHIKALEEQEADAKQLVEKAKRRTERKHREGFWSLLQELVERGVLNTATKWKEVHPLIKDDPRFLATLGQMGSTPLEMFWDMQHDMEERFQTERKLVTDVMKVGLICSSWAHPSAAGADILTWQTPHRVSTLSSTPTLRSPFSSLNFPMSALWPWTSRFCGWCLKRWVTFGICVR